MCLPIAVKDPSRVLGQGEHLGFEWMVTHNMRGSRCGYVRVMPGHPWHGKGYDDVRAVDDDYPDVHGGLTFASADQACDKPGDDNGWWLGFDCAHWGDAPDPALPDCMPRTFGDGEIRTQNYVEAECKSLCEQAYAMLRPTPSTQADRLAALGRHPSNSPFAMQRT